MAAVGYKHPSHFKSRSPRRPHTAPNKATAIHTVWCDKPSPIPQIRYLEDLAAGTMLRKDQGVVQTHSGRRKIKLKENPDMQEIKGRAY